MFLFACGGGETPPPATPAAQAASTTTPTASTTPASTGGATGTAVLTPAGSAGSKVAERRTSPTWTECHKGYKPTGTSDLGADVDKMANACAATTKMHITGDSFRGTQAASNVPQTYKFHALAKHCYRVYAAAATTITDLDLLVKDSTGAIVGEDSTDDPTPVVLEDGAVCYTADDDSSVVISVGGGSGSYAVQVWTD
jgi:hypothetical protein